MLITRIVAHLFTASTSLINLATNPIILIIAVLAGIWPGTGHQRRHQPAFYGRGNTALYAVCGAETEFTLSIHIAGL